MEKAPDPTIQAELALRAIRSGNGNELRELLQSGVDPNLTPTSGIKKGANNALLYHAVAKQDISMVQTLLEQGADAKGPNAQGFPPLRAAVIRNNLELIRLLLQRGADVNRPYTVVTEGHKETRSLLFEKPNVHTYELLLKSGANVQATDSRKETPLHYHASNWNSRLVDALVSAGANVNAVNKEKSTPLDCAIFATSSQHKFNEEDFMNVCRVLLKNNAVVPWSSPDEYFRSKEKPNMNSTIIKARLRLVHEWKTQRDKGDLSFRLPIEVFRRGALDIATYFTALSRDGRCRASVLPLKPGHEVALKAIETRNTSELASLIRAGVDVNKVFASGEDGQNKTTLLFQAVEVEAIGMVTMLLDSGADVNGSGDVKVAPPLHAAVKHDNPELVALLLTRGADVNRRYIVSVGESYTEQTVLFEVPSVATYKLLLRCGADVNARSSTMRTPLHNHVFSGKKDTIRVLLEHNANVYAVDQENITPLETAISDSWFSDEDFLDICRLLLEFKASVPWTTPSDYFRAKSMQESPATLSRVQLAIELAKQRALGLPELSSIPVHIFSEGPDAIVKFFQQVPQRTNNSDEVKVESVIQPESVLHRRMLKSFDELPTIQLACPTIELGKAPPGKKMLLQVVAHPSDPDRIECIFQAKDIDENLEINTSLNRCKVCVVGPSRWGKTSFIKSFTSGTRQLESVDVRTLGIDLFPWNFQVKSEAGDSEYQVSFWDFAGQEEYRAAHTLFYSARALYLLCIDLDQYHTQLSTAMNQTDANRIMDEFAEAHIFKWVRMICAHFPQASFAFLGTKADLVQNDPEKIAAVQQDIVARFKSSIRRAKDRVDCGINELKQARDDIQESDPRAETPELNDQIATWEKSRDKQPILLADEMIIFSSEDLTYEEEAHEKLKSLLTKSDTPIVLPSSYAEILKEIQQRCTSDPKHLLSLQEKVGTAFVLMRDFKKSLKLAVSEKEVLAALHLLHDTGDIVWFDGVPNLQERLFLDPVLLIEFIRQIINPNMDGKTSANGRVNNSLIQKLPYWAESDRSTLTQLKELLLHLNLAYAAGKSGKMKWDSDVIVPVYWDRDHEATLAMKVKPFPTEEDKSAGLIERVRWEYAFEPAIPDNLFEKLAVLTYSPLLGVKRNNGGSIFLDKVANESSARVAVESNAPKCSIHNDVDSISTVLSVSVAARDQATAWKHLVRYCTDVENLLKTYPGLLVTRYSVNQEGERFNVDQLLSDHEYFTQLTTFTDQEYLPADMKWYSDKWHHRTTATNAPSTLTETMQDKSRFPSLWTLQYEGFDDVTSDSSLITSIRKKVVSTVIVQFRSDLTGYCHHKPIVISVAKEFFSRFGKYLKEGLSLLSAAVPDVVGQLVVGHITDECKRQIDRSMEFHQVLHRAGVSEDPTARSLDMENYRRLRPNEVMDLLSCLLRLHDPEFKEENISQLSGLVCGMVKESQEFIWASRDEILQREDIKLVDDSSRPLAPSRQDASDSTGCTLL